MVCMIFLVVLPSLGEQKNQRNRVVDPSTPKIFLASRRSLEGQKSAFSLFPGEPTRQTGGRAIYVKKGVMLKGADGYLSIAIYQIRFNNFLIAWPISWHSSSAARSAVTSTAHFFHRKSLRAEVQGPRINAAVDCRRGRGRRSNWSRQQKIMGAP